MPSYETINPIIAPKPTLPNPVQFTGTVMLRCGPKGGPYNSLQLPANPDQDFTSPIRVTLTQTVTGLYFDDYGKGPTTFTITGSTAWVSPQGMYNGNSINGYDAAKHFNNDIINYYFQLEHDNSNPQDAELLVFDYTVNGSWSVKPINKIQFFRDKTSPMTYSYNCQFIVIRDLVNDPASPDFKPADPVQNLIVGLTTAPVSSTVPPPAKVASVIQSATTISQTQPRTYTVKSGDSLWSIAQDIYTDSSQWSLIFSANKQYIKNPNLIFPGQVLVIPPGKGANQSAS